MMRQGLAHGWLLGWIVALLANAIVGCCPRPELQASARSPEPPEAAAPPVLEPSMALRLLRDERLASSGPLEHVPRPTDARAPRAEPTAARSGEPPAPGAGVEPPVRDAADVEADEAADVEADQTADAEADQTADAAADPDSPPVGDAEADPDVRRVVVPRRSRLATPEDLFRAQLRDVELQRPRLLFVDRMLVRTSGPICDCEGSRKARNEARAFVETLVVRARPAIKACLAEALAEDPRVLVDAPALLVVSQAMRIEPIAYRFAPTVHLGPHGVDVRALGWPGDDVDGELESCLVRALEEADVEPASLTGEHRVQVPLVAFSQESWAVSFSGLNGALAFEAAALGWQHYERGEHEEALELFRDAHWVFHLAEYRYLQGLALEQLGHFDAAAEAYAEYLVERSYAPEAPMLKGRIDRLRGRAER